MRRILLGALALLFAAGAVVPHAAAQTKGQKVKVNTVLTVTPTGTSRAVKIELVWDSASPPLSAEGNFEVIYEFPSMNFHTGGTQTSGPGWTFSILAAGKVRWRYALTLSRENLKPGVAVAWIAVGGNIVNNPTTPVQFCATTTANIKGQTVTSNGRVCATIPN